MNLIGQRVRAGIDREPRLDSVQKATSQNYNPAGFAACGALRQHVSALDVMTQDWVHGFLSDGVMACEMWLLVQKAATVSGITMGHWEAFLKADLRFPDAYSTKGALLWRVFDEQHRYPDNPHKLEADASELLGLYSLMRHFVEVRFDGRDELARERYASDACCNAMDLILKMKNRIVDPSSQDACDQLESSIFAHLRLSIAAHGSTQHIKPKHHLIHCPLHNSCVEQES